MSILNSAKKTIRRTGARAEDMLQRVLADAGMRQSEAKISADSQAYWTEAADARWRSDSHWRDASVFAGTDLWSEIGLWHLVMFDRGARMVEFNGDAEVGECHTFRPARS